MTTRARGGAWRRGGIGLVALACAGAWSCAPEPERAPPPPPPAEVAVAEARDITHYERFTGQLRAAETAEIRARVTGYLDAIEFEPSSRVAAGQLLFVIEQAPYRIAVESAEARLERAEAKMALEDARLQRLRVAFDRQAATELEILEQEATVKEARGAVLVAEADLEAARLQLSYTEVRSPIGGLVDRSNIDRGNLVGAGSNTLLTTVRRINPIYAYFEVSEQIALFGLARRRVLEEGPQRVEPRVAQLGLMTDDGYPFEGVVTWAENTLDAGTGTIEVRAEFPNERFVLYPGLFARVRIPFDTIEGAVVVREEAVGTDLGGKYVYVVGEGSVVEKRAVVLGERQDDGTVHVAEGLEAGQRYIVRGMQRARPGLPVTERPFVAPGGER